MKIRPTKESVRKMGLLLTFIEEYQASNHGLNPSRREMEDELHISTSHVNHLLGYLIKEGKIEIEKGIARSITLLYKKTYELLECTSPECEWYHLFEQGTEYAGLCPDHPNQSPRITVLREL